MSDENLILYQYKVEEQQYLELKSKFNTMEKNLTQAFADLHFELIDLTNKEEWEKINRKIKISL